MVGYFSYTASMSSMVEHRYGKSSLELGSIKMSFIDDNNQLLDESLALNSFYTSQPERKVCKICDSSLIDSPVDLTSHGVQYKICKNCGHLNGLHLETDHFHDHIYSEDDNNLNKYDSAYEKRVKHIYLPKAEFLTDILSKRGVDKDSLTISDFGCGGGQFVNALLSLGIKAIGYDISASSIEIAQSQLSRIESFPQTSSFSCFNKLNDIDNMLKVAQECKSLVQSYIGVLEHVKSPSDAFNAFRVSNSSSLYFTVPLFSLSVIIENAFKNIFPRQLSSDHTHLFTHKSIDYLMQAHGLEIIASWHFGTDILDLRRSLLVTAAQNDSSNSLLNVISTEFLNTKLVDELQFVLDQNMQSSEVHIIAKKCMNNA